MTAGGPLRARLRALWHMWRRPGHRVATYYLGKHLVAMHCVDCKRAFFGRPVDLTRKDNGECS